MATYLKTWSVILKDGTVLPVPATIKGKYEDIELYGHQAVLERVYRTRAYKRAIKANDDNRIRTIVFPDGQHVTQF